ncbi:NirD/YgiW/YdeI family stress tolerance protein [Turicimonas muris]|uniref:NirD/YgiW/YdeI family stress tolerance protein n=1 Tax=Turicimonas muris TaxID=1796652 RepID=UPI003312FD8C
MLRDQTGEILVDIDNHVFRGQQVTPQTQVLLHGEVDKDFGHQAEIDVDTLQIVR